MSGFRLQAGVGQHLIAAGPAEDTRLIVVENHWPQRTYRLVNLSKHPDVTICSPHTANKRSQVLFLQHLAVFPTERLVFCVCTVTGGHIVSRCVEPYSDVEIPLGSMCETGNDLIRVVKAFLGKTSQKEQYFCDAPQHNSSHCVGFEDLITTTTGDACNTLSTCATGVHWEDLQCDGDYLGDTYAQVEYECVSSKSNCLTWAS